MTRLAATLLVLPLLLGGCSSRTTGLFLSEIEFLAEDVLDLMTIVFQAGENAFVGDSIEPEDIVEDAGPGNGFTITYDLPFDDRVGLGDGFGRVALRVTEDAVANEDPFDFSFAGTDALTVVLDYELRYEGVTVFDRATDVDLLVTVTATRADPADAFLVEYFVEGEVFLGATFTDIVTRFRAPGRPRDGVEAGFGDGEGVIDDPDVGAGVFDYDLDFRDLDFFRAEGEIGGCCFFKEDFFYEEVL